MEKELQEMKEQVDRLLRELEGEKKFLPGRPYRGIPDEEFLEMGPGYPREFWRGMPPGRRPGIERYQGRGLGVRIREVDPTLASHLKLNSGQGVVIEQVLDGSPASAGGLKTHDVVLLLNGRAIAGSGASASAVGAMFQAVAGAPAGKPVAVEVIRGGERMRLEVTIGKERGPESGERKA
jgi:PDZ domain-containing protein